MPWWGLYASNVPPAPQQPYFNVLCAKRETVQLEGRPASVPFPGSVMGKSQKCVGLRVESRGRSNAHLHTFVIAVQRNLMHDCLGSSFIRPPLIQAAA